MMKISKKYRRSVPSLLMEDSLHLEDHSTTSSSVLVSASVSTTKDDVSPAIRTPKRYSELMTSRTRIDYNEMGEKRRKAINLTGETGKERRRPHSFSRGRWLKGMKTEVVNMGESSTVPSIPIHVPVGIIVKGKEVTNTVGQRGGREDDYDRRRTTRRILREVLRGALAKFSPDLDQSVLKDLVSNVFNFHCRTSFGRTSVAERRRSDLFGAILASSSSSSSDPSVADTGRYNESISGATINDPLAQIVGRMLGVPGLPSLEGYLVGIYLDLWSRILQHDVSMDSFDEIGTCLVPASVVMRCLCDTCKDGPRNLGPWFLDEVASVLHLPRVDNCNATEGGDQDRLVDVDESLARVLNLIENRQQKCDDVRRCWFEAHDSPPSTLMAIPRDIMHAVDNLVPSSLDDRGVSVDSVNGIYSDKENDKNDDALEWLMELLDDCVAYDKERDGTLPLEAFRGALAPFQVFAENDKDSFERILDFFLVGKNPYESGGALSLSDRIDYVDFVSFCHSIVIDLDVALTITVLLSYLTGNWRGVELGIHVAVADYVVMAGLERKDYRDLPLKVLSSRHSCLLRGIHDKTHKPGVGARVPCIDKMQITRHRKEKRKKTKLSLVVPMAIFSTGEERHATRWLLQRKVPTELKEYSHSADISEGGDGSKCLDSSSSSSVRITVRKRVIGRDQLTKSENKLLPFNPRCLVVACHSVKSIADAKPRQQRQPFYKQPYPVRIYPSKMTNAINSIESSNANDYDDHQPKATRFFDETQENLTNQMRDEFLVTDPLHFPQSLKDCDSFHLPGGVTESRILVPSSSSVESMECLYQSSIIPFIPISMHLSCVVESSIRMNYVPLRDDERRCMYTFQMNQLLRTLKTNENRNSSMVLLETDTNELALTEIRPTCRSKHSKLMGKVTCQEYLPFPTAEYDSCKLMNKQLLTFKNVAVVSQLLLQLVGMVKDGDVQESSISHQGCELVISGLWLTDSWDWCAYFEGNEIIFNSITTRLCRNKHHHSLMKKICYLSSVKHGSMLNYSEALQIQDVEKKKGRHLLCVKLHTEDNNTSLANNFRNGGVDDTNNRVCVDIMFLLNSGRNASLKNQNIDPKMQTSKPSRTIKIYSRVIKPVMYRVRQG